MPSVQTKVMFFQESFTVQCKYFPQQSKYPVVEVIMILKIKKKTKNCLLSFALNSQQIGHLVINLS